MTNTQDYEPASSAREQDARDLFPISTSPEEYAAREAHRWMMFSFGNYSYSDPTLHAWIHRFNAILQGSPGAPDLEVLRAKYLSPSEQEKIRQEIEREDDEF